MKQNTALILLLIGSVLVVALAVPSMLRAGSNLLQGLRDWVEKGFGDLANTDTAHLGLTIYYVDGTKKDFQPSEPFSLLPLRIDDEGGEVSSIEAHVGVSLQYGGQISSWDLECTVRADIKQGTTTLTSQWKQWSFNKQGTAWHESTQVIETKTITAEELEHATASWGEGDYTLYFELDLTMTVSFTDGQQQTMGANTLPASWNYHYVSMGIKSLSAIIYVQPLRP